MTAAGPRLHGVTVALGSAARQVRRACCMHEPSVDAGLAALGNHSWSTRLHLQEDDLSFQTEDLCQQRLLVVGQGTPLLTLSLQLVCQRSNSPHKVLRAKAL